MKLIANVYWITVLSLSSLCYGQEGRIFTSIEEAQSVPVDSVFRLDLSKQKLKSIPEEIYQFTYLEELYLGRNKLDSLPENFFLPNLKVLDLTKNDFHFFPEAICQNTSLQQLLMGKNHMDSIPECIGDLTELRVLDLWFNPITSLPETLTSLRKLKSLDLRGMNYSPEFQKKWSMLLPWVKIEFDLGCDCGY